MIHEDKDKHGMEGSTKEHRHAHIGLGLGLIKGFWPVAIFVFVVEKMVGLQPNAQHCA